MADPEHVRWILEGSDSWNQRRQEKQFTPDLSGVDLYEEFQKAGKLDAQGEIPLPGINLRGASLEWVTARRINLEGADLCEARVRGGNLSDARMKRVKLRHQRGGTDHRDRRIPDRRRAGRTERW